MHMESERIKNRIRIRKRAVSVYPRISEPDISAVISRKVFELGG